MQKVMAISSVLGEKKKKPKQQKHKADNFTGFRGQD